MASLPSPLSSFMIWRKELHITLQKHVADWILGTNKSKLVHSKYALEKRVTEPKSHLQIFLIYLPFTWMYSSTTAICNSPLLTVPHAVDKTPAPQCYHPCSITVLIWSGETKIAGSTVTGQSPSIHASHSIKG